MSLTSALRSSSLPFPTSPSPSASPTGQDTVRAFHHEPSYTHLNRMLIRYQHLILLTPDPNSEISTNLTPLQRQIQAELWSPLPYHRTKWLHNIEGARNLLLQLERAAQNIKVQKSKQNAQKDLAEKRVVIKKLRNRIEEIGREVEAMGEEAWKLPQGALEQRQSVYDILQERRWHSEVEKRQPHENDTLVEGRPVNRIAEEESPDPEKGRKDDANELFNTSSTIRRRPGQQSTQSNPNQGHATGASGMDADERALLDSSRTQEDLTASLVSMAAQLKQQARAFQFSLDQDKGLLNRTLEGLDRNISGMEAASKNMAFLTRMSEGEGWLGRLKLYAMIFGMWVVAILLVFVAPKLRF